MILYKDPLHDYWFFQQVVFLLNSASNSVKVFVALVIVLETVSVDAVDVLLVEWLEVVVVDVLVVVVCLILIVLVVKIVI